MTLQTTALQFGYLLAWLFSILLIIRGVRNERLSDKLLAFVMFLLAQEIQDYTFGFAGINFLWEDLNGFPRYTDLLLGPATYFYIQSQINQKFRFMPPHARHLIPWATYFIIYLLIFVQGKHAVQNFQTTHFSIVLDWVLHIAVILSYSYYFYLSLEIYHKFRQWVETQFADTEKVNFVWFRNFIYIMIVGQIFKWIWLGLDTLMSLNFSEEWWWNLALVFIICYVGIQGYAQVQPNTLIFRDSEEKNGKSFEFKEHELLGWKNKLLKLMEEDKIYLDPELSLSRLAMILKTNTTLLSALINSQFNKNFNDFINEYRINEYQKRIKMPHNQHLSNFGVALDSGFNSKATFNRAFKKLNGVSPKEFTVENKT